MPLGRGKSGSQIKYIQSLSPTAISSPGSGTAYNLNDFQWFTVMVNADSADAVVNVERSSASNGTFEQFGASIQTEASKLVVRSFRGSSLNWYKFSYDNNNSGSVNLAINVACDEGRYNPVLSQDANTTVLSNVV
jgi:hypothetical protein